MVKQFLDDPMVIERLVDRCREGDALAWESLVRRFQGRIFGLAFFYVKDHEEARDMAQEVFVRVYRGLEGFQNGQAFVPWMIALARNCCIDHLRRRNVRANLSENLPDHGEDPPHPGPSPYLSLEQSTRKKMLYQALDRMSPQSREMILLKEIQGLKLQDVADLLAIPLGTAKSRSGRARQELASVIQRLNPEMVG